MCVCKTGQNTISATLGVAAIELLPPNPRRKAFMFSPTPLAAGVAHAISLGFSQGVTPGQGFLNYLLNQYTDTIITDEHVGNAITQPIFAICGDANTPVTIVEFTYDREQDDPAGKAAH